MNVHATGGTTDGFDQLRQLVANLHHWRPQIERALHFTDCTHSFDDIVGQVMSHRLYFFSTADAFAIMERVQYPQYANLHCFLAGGRLSTLLDHIDNMKLIGAQLGCSNFTMAGRRGWDRVLTKRGWNHACTTMSTPIGEGED